MSKKNKADNIIKIPTVHTMTREDMSQEQLRVILNNELLDIVSKAGIDVPVTPMTYVEELAAQETDIPAGKTHKLFTRRSGDMKLTHFDKAVRLSVMGIFIIFCIIAFKSSPAYALDNPVEIASLGTSYENVEKCFGEPDIGDEDADMLMYSDVTFLGMDGILTVLLDKNNCVASCEWSYSFNSDIQAEMAYRSLYNQISQIMGELGDNNSSVYSWRMDGYRLMMQIDYKTLTLALY